MLYRASEIRTISVHSCACAQIKEQADQAQKTIHMDCTQG